MESGRLVAYVTLKSRFPEIEAELRPRISAAVKAAAEGIEHGAKERAPVDTGALRSAIHTERRGPAEYAVVAGDSQAWYGMLVEHGTSQNPPHPFLVPAAEIGREAAEGLVRAALRGL